MKTHILYASSIASRQVSHSIKLRPSQQDTLILIWQNPGCTLADLCAFMPYDRTTVTKATAYLRDTLHFITTTPTHQHHTTPAGRDYCNLMESIFYTTI
jgi:hypothetical protein